MAEALPARVTISPDVLTRELDGEMVLLNLANESYYGLDEVGTRMWQLFAEHSDVDRVFKQLLAEYDVQEAALRRDLGELIGNLRDAGLLTIG